MEDRMISFVRSFNSLPMMGKLYNPGAEESLSIIFFGTDEIDEECLEAIRNLRASTEGGVAIVVFYATSDLEHEIMALEAGADDCIRISIDWRYALARLRATTARLRRGSYYHGSPLLVDVEPAVDVDPYTHEVMANGQRVRLSPMQFRFLLELVRERGKVVHHDHLERLLWGDTGTCARQSLKQLVRRLRQQLSTASGSIVSMPGIGYMLR